MACLKCGREVPGGGVFCESCLVDMAVAPVAPGTPVQLPDRSALARRPTPRRRPDEKVQLARARLTIRRLAVTVALLSLLLIGAAVWIGLSLTRQREETEFGRNYSTVQPFGTESTMFHVKHYPQAERSSNG